MMLIIIIIVPVKDNRWFVASLRGHGGDAKQKGEVVEYGNTGLNCLVPPF